MNQVGAFYRGYRAGRAEKAAGWETLLVGIFIGGAVAVFWFAVFGS